MRIDLNCPAEVVGTELIREEEDWVRLILMDLTDRSIDSCEATIRILNREGEELGRTVHRARSLRGRPHSAFSMMAPVELPEGAAAAEATLDKVWFEDRDVWRRDPSRETEYESNRLAPGNELNALRYVAGEAAVGFPSQQAELWVCVCGRPNGNREQICARCRRQKDMIFQMYNRNAALRQVSQRERQLDLQTRGALEENNRLQRMREEEYNLAQARRRRRIRLAVALCFALALAAGIRWLGLPFLRLKSAETALREDRPEEALEVFSSLGNFPGAAEGREQAVLRITRRDGALAAENPDGFSPERMTEIAAALGAEGAAQEDRDLADRVTLAKARALLDAGSLAEAEEALASLPEGMDGRADMMLECAFARGQEALAARDYDRAREIFAGLGDYPGAAEKAREAVYEQGLQMMEAGEYDRAAAAFAEIESFRDSGDMKRRCFYLKGYVLENQGDMEAAREAYLTAGDWEDAPERARSILWNQAERLLATENYAEALPIYREMDGYLDAREKWIRCATELARVSYRQREYVQAATWLEDLPEDTKDTRNIRTRGWYLGAKAAANRGELAEAIALMEKAAPYSDSARNIRTWRIELARQKMEEGNTGEAREILAPVEEHYQAQRLLKEIAAKEAEAAAKAEAEAGTNAGADADSGTETEAGAKAGTGETAGPAPAEGNNPVPEESASTGETGTEESPAPAGRTENP